MYSARWLALLIIPTLGCASTTGSARSDAPVGSCHLADIGWSAAPDHFDQGRTSDAATKLKSVAQADREAYASGHDGNAVGSKLGELAAEVPSGVFVSSKVADLAVRLRQLDCAIQRGTFKDRADQADRLYAEILTELSSEQQLSAR